MGIASTLMYKTIGIAGLSFATYDALGKAAVFSKVGEQTATADTFESTIAAKRTMSTSSGTTNVMQSKVAEFRSSNPIIPFVGKFKGYMKGFLQSAGENIIPIVFSGMALAGGQKARKAGAIGLGGYSIYMVLKEGFGIGKTTPVD